MPAFIEWSERLQHPPLDPISDRPAIGRALQAGLLEFLRDQRTLYYADASVLAVEEEAPPGWDNATLLAEMQASERAGHRA